MSKPILHFQIIKRKYHLAQDKKLVAKEFTLKSSKRSFGKIKNFRNENLRIIEVKLKTIQDDIRTSSPITCCILETSSWYWGLAWYLPGFFFEVKLEFLTGKSELKLTRRANVEGTVWTVMNDYLKP